MGTAAAMLGYSFWATSFLYWFPCWKYLISKSLLKRQKRRSGLQQTQMILVDCRHLLGHWVLDVRDETVVLGAAAQVDITLLCQACLTRDVGVSNIDRVVFDVRDAPQDAISFKMYYISRSWYISFSSRHWEHHALSVYPLLIRW